MKKQMNPGDMFNKFQKKKKESQAGAKLLPNRIPGGSFVNSRSAGIPSIKNNASSTQAMMKRKHSKKHKKNWIANAIKKPGALHAELGIKKGQKIPAKTLAKAAKKGGKEGKRARLAETLKSFHHKHKKSDMKHCKTCSC